MHSHFHYLICRTIEALKGVYTFYFITSNQFDCHELDPRIFLHVYPFYLKRLASCYREGNQENKKEKRNMGALKFITPASHALGIYQK